MMSSCWRGQPGDDRDHPGRLRRPPTARWTRCASQASQVGANDMVISTLTHNIDHHEYEQRRLQAPLLHRLDARARHRDCARCARAASGPARRAGDVDQPRALATTASGEQLMSTYDPTSTEGLAEHASERLRDERPRAVHVRPLGERVPVRREGRLRAGGPGCGLEHLPHRLSAVRAGRRARRWASSRRRCTRPASWR